MGNHTFESRVALAFIARFLNALNCARRRTRDELQAELFASKTKMTNYIRFLHGDDGGEKRIYICAYRIAENGARVPVYTRGSLPDAEKPPAKTGAQRWASIRSDPMRHEARCRNVRARASTKHAVKRPQNPFSALGL